MTRDRGRTVRQETRDGVGWLTLDRRERLNAFSPELAEEFVAAMESLSADPGVRAIVVRGEGRVFSVGGDVGRMLQGVEAGDPAAYFREPLAAFHRMVVAARNSPRPVLAVVHGAVAGVAFNLMLACDLRLAAAGTRFTQAFARLGLSPDGGGTWALGRQLGHARACELAMLPTEIDADRALELGLVNWVVPLEGLGAETDRRARQLASGPTAAIARTKALIRAAEGEGFAEHLEAERLAQVENAATADFAEGLRAFQEKRQPRFGGAGVVRRGGSGPRSASRGPGPPREDGRA